MSEVLAKPAIAAAIKDGSIFISNYDERQLNNCSYDIRLGNMYYEEQAAVGFTLLDPYHPEMIAQMWGEPKKAIVPGPGYPIKRGLSRGMIAIPPKGFLLCHTEEFIGCTDTVKTTMIKARSTTGRIGVHIAACAGWGDIGFCNRWTLEVRNNSQYRTMLLRPGMRVGQIVFLPTTGVEQPDLYYHKGKYQKGAVFNLTHEELVAAWKPESMLPRAWEDWDAPALIGTDPPEKLSPIHQPRRA